jgi:hypothetical protein
VTALPPARRESYDGRAGDEGEHRKLEEEAQALARAVKASSQRATVRGADATA